MQSVEELKDTAQSELKDWLNNPTYGKNYFDEKIQEINKILDGTNIKSVFRQFDYLDIWYSNNFVFHSLEKEALSNEQALIAANGYHVVIMADELARLFPGNPPKIQFDKYLYWLANCIIVGWDNRAREIVDILNKNLDTNLLKGGADYKITAWYILTLINKFFNINVDYKEYNYPNGLGVYQNVIDNWDTNDLDLVSKFVSELSDFHLKQADPKDEDTLLEVQFSKEHEYVYAFEILCWLRLREMRGLKNPTDLTHPLMQLKLNSLPNLPISFPKDELAEKVIQRLKS